MITYYERVKIHQILDIGLSLESVNLVKERIEWLAQNKTIDGIGYLKEILTDTNLDKSTLSKFLSIKTR
jgi:hypothetical protein